MCNDCLFKTIEGTLEKPLLFPPEKLKSNGCCKNTDCGRLVRKSPSLNGRKSTHTPKFLGMAKQYFVCHICPNFQIFFYLCLHWESIVRVPSAIETSIINCLLHILTSKSISKRLMDSFLTFYVDKLTNFCKITEIFSTALTWEVESFF